jgi:hypothetical protein
MQRVQQYLALPGSEGLFDHRVFRRSEIRSLYDNNLFMLPPEDTPGTATRVRSVLTEYYGFLRSLGSELHLNGEAGDAVLDLAPRYYAAELLRVGSLRKFLTTVVETSRLEYSAPYKTLAESLSARDLIPPRSLTHIAAALDQLAQGRSTWRLDPQALFAGVAAHWLTPQAGRGLAELAAGTEAGVTQGMGVGNQQAYAQIRQIGSGSQDTLRLGAAHGLRVHSPFMDNDVLRACFSVLASKRVNPWEFKPLLGKALEGLVPAEVTSRTSKGSGRRVADELRASIPFLRALLQDSYVADLGIINPKAVWRDVEMGLAGGYMPWASLDVLVSTEVWLRRLNGETGVRPKDTSARPASQKVDKMLPALKYPATTKFGLTEQSVLLAGEFSAVAMNMTSGVCFRLNSSAVKVLEALRDTEDLAGAVALLHEQYPRADRTDIWQATEVCIARLQKAGVLGIHSAPWEIIYVDESDQAEVSGERVRPPAEGNYQLQARDYLAALGGVTLGRIVKSMPFAKQARLLSRVERSAWVRHESAPHQTERTLAAVHRVMSLYMGRAACVELTMATVLTEALKRRQVDFVIGLRTDPEGFHVWPEAQGIPVRTNRDPEVQGAYKTFARIGRSTTGMKR